MNDERLRSTYQELVSARTPADRARCPSVEDIAGALEIRAREADRIAVLDHAMQCAACRREFELLRSVVAARPPTVASRGLRFALAATVVMAVGLSLFFARSRDGTPGGDVFRARSDSVTLLGPRGAVTATQAHRLAWRAVPNAETYVVELLDSTDAVRFSAALTDTTVTVPDSVRLTEDAPYDWWVRARLVDGREVASPFARFRPR